MATGSAKHRDTEVTEDVDQDVVAARRSNSEHGVRVRRRCGDGLQDIPVLHDLSSVIQPKDVDPGPVLIAGPMLKAVQDDVVALGDDATELDAFVRILRAMRSKYSMNASLPSATLGLCCV
jgi:hypothetical protein